MEVTGATKEEALAKAPFKVIGDATQKYKMWKKKQTSAITDSDKKQFMLDYLQDKVKCAPGVGFAITQESAVSNTRERPYHFEDIVGKGSRKYKKIFQLKDAKTGVVLGEVDTTKGDAKNLAKSLYTEQGYKGDIICTYTKQVVGGEPLAFKASYTPSVNAREGVYTVFGMVND